MARNKTKEANSAAGLGLDPQTAQELRTAFSGPKLSGVIEAAMSRAVQKCAADGITDSAKIREAMLKVRSDILAASREMSSPSRGVRHS